jgi:hypothetical protein
VSKARPLVGAILPATMTLAVLDSVQVTAGPEGFRKPVLVTVRVSAPSVMADVDVFETVMFDISAPTAESGAS